MRSLPLLLLALAACAPGTPATPAPHPEAAAVLATVQAMADAMRTKDTASFRRLFEPGARLTGMRVRRATGDTILRVLSVGQFADFIARDTRAPWVERLFDAEVRVEGSLATVWAAYDFHFGTTFSHCGVDAFQLHRTPQGWLITALADTYQPTGCPTRTPVSVP
jgi:hypothetical protein